MKLVFLSNEVMPLVLERDDRRYVVIWVPPKLSQLFFDDVNDEINAGGIQALHHHLMNLDLGDFNEHTKPPLTRAKMDLQELGKSSEGRFLNDWCCLERWARWRSHSSLPLLRLSPLQYTSAMVWDSWR